MIVLIADDDGETRELLSRLVALQGYEPVAVASSEEAVEQARALCPNLIFIDTTLTQTSGGDALGAIREDQRLSATPIVAFTEDAAGAEPGAFRAAGYRDVLTKPLDISRVQELLIQYGNALSGDSKELEAENG